MIKNGYLLCHCGKKIMPITEHDVISATVYCHVCRKYLTIIVADGKLFKSEERR
jgi:hypothetical protein